MTLTTKPRPQNGVLFFNAIKLIYSAFLFGIFRSFLVKKKRFSFASFALNCDLNNLFAESVTEISPSASNKAHNALELKVPDTKLNYVKMRMLDIA